MLQKIIATLIHVSGQDMTKLLTELSAHTLPPLGCQQSLANVFDNLHVESMWSTTLQDSRNKVNKRKLRQIAAGGENIEFSDATFLVNLPDPQ